MTQQWPYAALEDSFPFIRDKLKEGRNEWFETGGTNGVHATWDTVSSCLMEPLLNSATVDTASMTVFFAWLESLAGSTDSDLIIFVETEVCERIGDSDEWVNCAMPYMGVATRKLFHHSQAFWGRNAGE